MSKRQKNAEEEIKCRPTTAAFDLRVKAEEAERLLLQGVRIKLLIQFKSTPRAPLEAAQAPLSYFIEHLQSGVPVGEPTIHENAVVQLFEPGCGPRKASAGFHNPNDDPSFHEGGDDLLPQYQLEVLVQEEAKKDDSLV